MNYNIKNKEEYEWIKSDFKKHIYNNIEHLNINNDAMEKIYDGIDNIFDIICWIQTQTPCETPCETLPNNFEISKNTTFVVTYW
jgi:hypothetical protein